MTARTQPASVLLLAALGLIVFASAACGDSDTSSGDGGGTATQSAASPSPTKLPPQPEPTATNDIATASAGTIVPETIVPGTPEPLPSATPQPPMDVVEVRLKYALFDRFGDLWWCDPDFYPIAREDEQILAQERFAEIERDGPTFAAILAHLGYADANAYTNAYTSAQTLAIYRDWKALRGLQLDLAADEYHFNARFTHDEETGVLVDGVIDLDGRIVITSQQDAEPPMCPICLARGTRIATPDGPVAVEDLRAGMSVWTAGADGARMRADVLTVGMMPAPALHRVVHLVLADGRSLRASPSHPLADGRLLGAISAGDFLDGSIVVSAQSERYDGGATFDLLPSGPTGTYWANGVLLASTISLSTRTDLWEPTVPVE